MLSGLAGQIEPKTNRRNPISTSAKGHQPAHRSVGTTGKTGPYISWLPVSRDEWVGALGYDHWPVAQLHHLVVDTAQEEGCEVGKPA